jgi:hypothetical protein
LLTASVSGDEVAALSGDGTATFGGDGDVLGRSKKKAALTG